METVIVDHFGKNSRLQKKERKNNKKMTDAPLLKELKRLYNL